MSGERSGLQLGLSCSRGAAAVLAVGAFGAGVTLGVAFAPRPPGHTAHVGVTFIYFLILKRAGTRVHHSFLGMPIEEEEETSASPCSRACAQGAARARHRIVDAAARLAKRSFCPDNEETETRVWPFIKKWCAHQGIPSTLCAPLSAHALISGYPRNTWPFF